MNSTSNGGNTGQFGKYAPPSKAEQIAKANQQGPADEGTLERLAQFADQQDDFGDWHYGHLTAQRLRLLAQQLEAQQEMGQEERLRLHRTIAYLAEQVDAAAQEGQDIDLTLRFVSDGPGLVQIGELHVMVSLLVEAEGKEDATK